jgi:hypothetical protein
MDCLQPVAQPAVTSCAPASLPSIDTNASIVPLTAAVYLNSPATCLLGVYAGHCLPLSWPAGMVRPAGNLKQSQAFYQQWGTPEEDAGPPTPAPPVSSMQDARTPHSTAGAGGSSTIVASSGGHRSKHQSSILRGSCLSMQQALGLIPWLAIPAAGAAAVGSDPAADQPQQQQQGSVVEAPQPRKHRKQQQRKVPPGWSLEAAAALHVPSGITLHPLRYLQALHAACKVAAAGRKVPGSCVQLHVQQLDSVQELLEPGTSWDGVAVAAGAAVGTLKEFQGLSPLLDLCQGYTLDLQPSSQGAAAAAAAAAAEGGRSKAGDAGGRLAEQTPASDVGQQQEVYGQGSAAELTTAGPLPVANLLRATDSRDVSDTNISSSHTPDNPSYPPGAPSILGQPYLASQGGQLLVLGASQDHEWLPTAALQECYHSDWLQHLADAAVGGHAAEPGATAGSSIDRRPALLAAAQKLLAGAAAVWPPVVAWQVAGVRSGVRALPPRGPQGSIPLVGAWNQPLRSAGDPRSDDSTSATTMSSSSSTPPPIWLCVGLGARGLVYHAWLGALVAQGILDGSEQHIPAELLAWKAALGKVEAGSCSAPRPDGQQS